MLLDEEALANQQARVAPESQPAPQAPPPEMLDAEAAAELPPDEPAAEPQAPAPARPATPQERKMFDKLLEQSLMFLTSESSAKYLIANSKSRPPEEVLAEAVQQVIDGAVGAAGAAGIQIPSSVRGVSTKAAVVAMSVVMVKAGLAQDPQKLARGALAILQSGEQPQQPPMEAANGAVG